MLQFVRFLSKVDVENRKAIVFLQWQEQLTTYLGDPLFQLLRVLIRGSFKSKCPCACSCPLADYTAKQQAYAILLLQTKNVLICVQMGAHR